MAVKYRLPCTCGKSITVDSSQSGLSVACACGRQIEVPTHRGLMQLERVDEPLAPARPASGGERGSPAWGLRQGLQFLGATALVAALALLIFVWTRPRLDPVEVVLEKTEPARAIQEWNGLRSGIDVSETEIGQALTKYITNKRMWEVSGYMLAGAGGLIVALSFLAPSKPRTR